MKNRFTSAIWTVTFWYAITNVASRCASPWALSNKSEAITPMKASPLMITLASRIQFDVLSARGATPARMPHPHRVAGDPRPSLDCGRQDPDRARASQRRIRLVERDPGELDRNLDGRPGRD